MADTLLILGPVVFQGFEVPEKINFGGKQRLHKHHLVGAGRVVDAMGPDEDDPHWDGRFRGANALSRAQTLDALRKAGAELPLSYHGMFWTVVIEHFEADVHRFYEVPYKIRCVVVTDPAAAALSALANSVSSILSADIGQLQLLGGAL